MYESIRYDGMRVTVMGLGLHGGGTASARYLASRGAHVTVTDLRDETVLEGSMAALSDYPIRYVLGRHEEADFRTADIVVKNPAVRADSPFLRIAPRVETDLSIFLSIDRHPVIAVTGSKGKSTTASAIHHAVLSVHPESRLGGNITVSPLDFIDEFSSAPPGTPVVLELSSWQLADLRGKGVLKPAVSVVTNILPDHQDRYRGMDEYVEDKLVIVEGQDGSGATICNLGDGYAGRFAEATAARVLWFSSEPLPAGTHGAWLEGGSGWCDIMGGRTEILRGARLPGVHSRMNLLAAGLALTAFGIDADTVRTGLAAFPGVPHRLEMLGSRRGIGFCNDSAATIPHATMAAVRSFETPVVLIAGGTDKNLDFSPLSEMPERVKAIILLQGTGTEKIKTLFGGMGIGYDGPFGSLEAALEAALSRSESGDTVLFSPGCTSFGMFLNEFHRGDTFRDLVRSLPG